MITGIGLDIVELERVAKLDERSDKFRLRILSTRELALYDKLPGHRKIEFLAGRFAAKEAFAKARGTGIGEGCRFGQIEILPEPSGKPVLHFDGGQVTGFVSITHTRTVAAAQVIILEN